MEIVNHDIETLTVEIKRGYTTQLSSDLNVNTAEINVYKQVAGEAIFEIGRRLKHVKDNDLAHGEFGKWLDTIGIESSQARRFMKVAAELYSKRGTYHNLGLRALYEIATMPEEQREQPHTIPSTSETKMVNDMKVRELKEVKKAKRWGNNRKSKDTSSIDKTTVAIPSDHLAVYMNRLIKAVLPYFRKITVHNLVRLNELDKARQARAVEIIKDYADVKEISVNEFITLIVYGISDENIEFIVKIMTTYFQNGGTRTVAENALFDKMDDSIEKVGAGNIGNSKLTALLVEVVSELTKIKDSNAG